MLVVSSFRDSTSENDKEEEMVEINSDDFPDFSSGSCLLDSFDFDEIFAGMEEDESDELPDLDFLGDYSISGTRNDELEQQSSDDGGVNREEEEEREDGNFDVVSAARSGSGLDAGSVCSQDEGVVDKVVVEVDGKKTGKVKKSGAAAGKAGRSRNKGCDGQRKLKVDWTPELHQRFVQAVEQLGEKAVPSRILETMGTEGLTRHNIASHLQKYRSHRKHLIAREVEAASWSQRRHLYRGARAGGPGKRVVSPWLLPTIGFPQPMPPPPLVHHHPAVMRPLHVWGHPSGDHSPANMWPKHIGPHHLHPQAFQPRPIWTPSPPYGPSQGMPCYPPPAQIQRFVAPPVPGIPHHQALYKPDPSVAAGPAASLHPPPNSSAPSSESIDAALENVLAKPWLPLPIGLKPPVIDSVVVELQRKGVPNFPPS